MTDNKTKATGLKSPFSPETIGAVMALKDLAEEFDATGNVKSFGGRLWFTLAIPTCKIDISVSTEDIACITGFHTPPGSDEIEIEPIIVPPSQIVQNVVELFIASENKK